MIPERLVDFVHGPILSWVGTRDQRLRPMVAWVFGVRVSPAIDEITIFVPDVEADRVRRNVDHNGQVAFTVVEPFSHEAYQFKGILAAARPSNDEEHAVQDIYRNKLVAHFTARAGGDLYARLAASYTLYPSTALRFRVEQIFVQTPGPGAGRQLDLAEA